MRWKPLTAGLALSALLLFGAQRLLSHPNTYGEAVAAALDEREIAYRDIQVGQPCQPDPGYCFASDYRMTYTTVVVYLDRPIYGRIECHAYHADCYLSLPDLQIRNAPLTDVAGTRPLLRVVEYGKSWLRERIRRLRGQSTPLSPETTQHSVLKTLACRSTSSRTAGSKAQLLTKRLSHRRERADDTER